MGMKQKYRILERLDIGGMAEVFRGRALGVEGIEKEVAIKRILPALTRKTRFREMFLDEARLSMRLNHANIVQVFDVGRAGETLFIVMEFIDGPNLRRIFQRASERGVRIPLKLACHIMMEVCKGLAHAHDLKDLEGRPLGIVHRDLSPPNVLISRAGEVKIVDFGLAKAVTQLTLTDPGMVKGKFSYLSPEAAAGEKVDHRADIFSAGIVLFELLSNRQLFRGQSDGETLELVKRAEIPPLSKLNPDVPEAFEAIVNRALARDPRQRYASARDFGDALSRFLFDNRLKVSSYDVQDTIRRLMEAPEEAEDPIAGRQRIEDLIEEEILNLSMIGHLTELTTEGSRPIRLEALRVDIKAQHDLSDVWETPVLAVGPGLDSEPAGAAEASGLSDRLEGDEPLQKRSVAERRREARDKDSGLSGTTIFLIAALVGAALFAGLYYFLVIKG